MRSFYKRESYCRASRHKVNTAMAQKIYKAVLNAEKEDAYPADVDIMAEPLMDINKIRMLLPHRPPFLLIDKIYKVTNNVVIGCKNVTMNEPFFVGHFPDEPGNAGSTYCRSNVSVRGHLSLEPGTGSGKLFDLFYED